MTQLTQEEYIAAFARTVQPIFVANDWRWATLGPGMNIPRIGDIEQMIQRLILELENDRDGNSFTASGRIVVSRVDESLGYILSLEMVSHFAKEN